MATKHLEMMRTYIQPTGDYSSEALRKAVLRSRKDIHDGKIVTIEEMRAKHPRV